MARQAQTRGDALRWEAGAMGEERTAQILATLGEKWTVLHDITGVPCGNLDHVIIGPRGIFVINTKNYRSPVLNFDRGVLYVNGKYAERLTTTSAWECEIVGQRLGRALGRRKTVNVTALLLFLNTHRLEPRIDQWDLPDAPVAEGAYAYRAPPQTFNGVPVVAENEFVDFINFLSSNPGDTFKDSEVAAISTLARDARNWDATTLISRARERDERVFLGAMVGLLAVMVALLAFALLFGQ